MRTIEDVARFIAVQAHEIPTQMDDTGLAVLGLATDTELYVRDGQEVDGNSKIRKFFYKLLAADELKESAGLKQSEEIRTEIAMAQRRIEGLKAELAPTDHVFLEGAVELYQLLNAKNEVSKKDLEKIREIVSKLYSINDSMATDKTLQLVDSILHTLLVDVLSAKATFGVSFGAKIFLKSLLIVAKTIAEKENNKQEVKTLQTGKEIKNELSKIDKFMVDLLSRGEDKDFSEYSRLMKHLFNAIENLENRQEIHKYILAVTKVNIQELVSTPDLVQNMRMLKFYEKNSTNISHVIERAKLVNDQINRLLSAKEILKEKSKLMRTSPEKIKAMKIEILLDSKIEVLKKESRILKKTIGKLKLLPQASRSENTEDGSNQQFHRYQARKGHEPISENKDFKFHPGLMPGSSELNYKKVILEEAHRTFLQSHEYKEYKEYEKQASSLQSKVENILEKMKKLKDLPAGEARESEYDKASNSLDKCLPEIRNLMYKIATIYLESSAKGMVLTEMVETLNGKRQELENLLDKAIEARTGTSPAIFATKVQTGASPTVATKDKKVDDNVTTFHMIAPPSIPAKMQSPSDRQIVHTALVKNSLVTQKLKKTPPTPAKQPQSITPNL